MRLQRSIRKTIQRGSTVIATAINYKNGRASVYLGGTLLTNLPAMGAITPGQQVAVDYSAGILPTVRPLGIPTEAVTPAPLQITYEKREKEQVDGQYLTDVLRSDYGVYAYIEHQMRTEDYGQFIQLSIETVIRWCANTVDPFDGTKQYCVIYDSANMYQAITSPYGTEFIDITQSGKYVIGLDINLGYPYVHLGNVELIYPGFFRVRLYAGGGLIAEETAWSNQSINLCSIASLSAGDQVYATIYANFVRVDPNESTPSPEQGFVLDPAAGWGFFESNNASICVQLLPGTQQI